MYVLVAVLHHYRFFMLNLLRILQSNSEMLWYQIVSAFAQIIATGEHIVDVNIQL